MYDQLSKEEKYLYDSIVAARQVQTFLWGEANGEWGLEGWRRMFRKRAKKLDDINPENPHAIVELRKRLLQNAALSIALLGVLDADEMPNESSDIPSNLQEYAIEGSEPGDEETFNHGEGWDAAPAEKPRCVGLSCCGGGCESCPAA